LLFINIVFCQTHPNFLIKKNGLKQDELVHIFIKGNPIIIEQEVKNAAGYVKYIVGDVVAAVVLHSKYEQFLKSDFFTSIEQPYYKGQVMGDQSRINNNVVPVHNGAAPLSQSYSGSGVIIGVLDSGLDFNHPDFIRANGNSRVRYLWDQNVTTGPGNIPLPYNYGRHWDSSAINNNTCTHTPDLNFYGHGTGTTGIAAGNGQNANNFKGIAPNSDIIFVAIDFDGNSGVNFASAIADGANYCFTKAALLGKPCVINASLGSYNGSHDGTELSTIAIENMITAQAGRSFVAACGNSGGAFMHLAYNLTPTDSNYTWFAPFNAGGSFITYFELFSDYTNWNSAQFQIGVDKIGGGTYSKRGRTKLLNVLADFQMATLNNFTRYDTIRNQNGQQLGILETYCEKQNGHYFMYFGIYVDSVTNYNWRFLTKGTGSFDVWSHPSYTGTSTIIRNNLPTASQFPDIIKYKLPDTLKTIVGLFNCSPKVISVANYLNRNNFITWQGNTNTVTSMLQGHIYPSSSMGPSRTNVQKPDIAASGEYTMAANDLYWLNWAKTNNPAFIGQDTMHGPHRGTSASAPAVAGAIALFLSKNPTATWADIKTSITTCVKIDAFTGTALPNAIWGYGKLDAMKMLNCVGCTINGATNYNPYALINDGSCIGIPAPANDLPCNAHNFSSNINAIACCSGVLTAYDNGNSNFDGLLNQSAANPPVAPNLVFTLDTTSTATYNQLLEPSSNCFSGSIDKTVWYSFKVPAMAKCSIIVRTNYPTTNFSTIISVYSITGNICISPVYNQINCTNSGFLLLTPSQLANFTGQQLYIQIKGQNNSSGIVMASIQALLPKLVLNNPTANAMQVTLPSSMGAITNLVLKYRIAGTTGFSQITLPTNASTYTLTGLLPNKNYQVWAAYTTATQTFITQCSALGTLLVCNNQLPAIPNTVNVPNHCGQVMVSWAAMSSAFGPFPYKLFWRKLGSNIVTGINLPATFVPTNGYLITKLTIGSIYQIWYATNCTDGAINSPIKYYTTCIGTPKLSNDTLVSGQFENYSFIQMPIDQVVLSIINEDNVTNEIFEMPLIINTESTFSEISLSNTLKIFPNPTNSSFVNIETSLPLRNKTKVTITAIDMIGKRRLLNYKMLTDNKFELDIENLYKGNYVIKLESESEMLITKLLITD
jgi:subtilisin family serine protease